MEYRGFKHSQDTTKSIRLANLRRRLGIYGPEAFAWYVAGYTIRHRVAKGE